jgi:hypothetical protein
MEVEIFGFLIVSRALTDALLVTMFSKQLLQFGEFNVCHPLGGVTAGDSLEGFSYDEQIRKIGKRELGHSRANVRRPLDELAALEPADGLAERAPAYAKGASKRLFAQLRSGRQFTFEYRRLQPLNDRADEGLSFDRFDSRRWCFHMTPDALMRLCIH